MNKITLLASFTIVVLLHILVFTYVYKKEVPVINKPPYQKVSIQFRQLKLPPPPKKKVEKEVKKVEPKKEPIKKIVKKEIPTPPKPKAQAKKVFKKPIKKEAKRELVKKTVKKEEKVKKIVKTPPKPKKIVEKKVAKKDPPKKIEEIKKVVKKVEEPKKIEKVEVKKSEKFLKESKEKLAQAAQKAAAKSLEKFRKFKEDYKTALRVAIDRNKRYPSASKRLEEEGLVVISFRVLKSGVFENIRVLTSSGKKRLDRAALKALRLTKEFRAFDKSIKKDFMDLEVPIKFQLN